MPLNNPSPRVHVIIYPESNENHLLQIYTGLNDLSKEGYINLSYSTKLPSNIRKFRPFTLWTEMIDTQTNKNISVCFDMVDGDIIASPDGLNKCDVYFKRSYARTHIDSSLPIHLSKKVKPYGLCYSLLSNYPENLLIRFFSQSIIHLRAKRYKYFSVAALQFLRLLQSKSKLKSSNKSIYPLQKDVEFLPDKAVLPFILYQVRLWAPCEVSRTEDLHYLQKMNQFRVETVRILKGTFKDKFLGGLIRTKYAQENYRNLITNLYSDRQSYIKLLKICLIAINTHGLSYSIGQKIPEYLSTSKCIVSQPLKYDLPLSLKENVNYIPFNTPEECVNACKKILDNQKLISFMKKSNWNYYLNNVKPLALMRNCINKVFDYNILQL